MCLQINKETIKDIICGETILKSIQTPKSYNLEITFFVNKIIMNVTFILLFLLMAWYFISFSSKCNFNAIFCLTLEKTLGERKLRELFLFYK